MFQITVVELVTMLEQGARTKEEAHKFLDLFELMPPALIIDASR